MTIDAASLERLARYDDPSAGISEQFLQPVLGGASTVAVLSRPLVPRSSLGWVICHSFAMEHVHLYRLEVFVSRALAAAGFPVLRFHSQGYGDSQGGAVDVSLASHLAGAADAVGLLASSEGVERVGIMGARFGGTVAALTAHRLSLPDLVLWEPVISGSRFMRDFLWRRVFSDLASGDPHEAHDVQGPMSQLESQGWADVNGFLLRKDVFEEVSALDLVAAMGGFSGASLLISVSRSSDPSPGAARLAERLRSGSSDSSLEVVTSQYAAELGQSHFRADEEIVGKKDTQIEITREVAQRTVAWSAGRGAAGDSGGGRS
jgi:pimeloyl-ACP methyl ester carboxylesterase